METTLIIEYSPTGSNTLLQSLRTISVNGSWMEVPKNCRSKAGVKNTPPRLLITALHNDDATFPPAADVRKIHMLTVVGKQVRMRMPSSSAGGRRFGKNVARTYFNGTPTRKGHTTNVDNCTAALSLWLDAASFSSDSSSESPDSRKIKVTPNFPIKSSGLRSPPSLPNCSMQR